MTSSVEVKPDTVNGSREQRQDHSLADQMADDHAELLQNMPGKNYFLNALVQFPRRAVENGRNFTMVWVEKILRRNGGSYGRDSCVVMEIWDETIVFRSFCSSHLFFEPLKLQILLINRKYLSFYSCTKKKDYVKIATCISTIYLFFYFMYPLSPKSIENGWYFVVLWLYLHFFVPSNPPVYLKVFFCV